MLILTALIQQSFGSPSHSNQRRKKKKKRIQIGKEVVKVSHFADDMILYKKYPKDTTRKPLELITKFGKVERYETVCTWV